MDYEGQRWVLKALREAGDELIDQFHGATDEELCGRLEDDGQSLLEIAGHLRDNEELSAEQIRLIAGEDEPDLPARDLDALSEERSDESADVSDLLRAFAGFRRQTYRLLASLEPEDWERWGRHPYRGSVTIAQIARELAEHDLGHLWEARRLKEALGWGREQR